jgi:hypothetical protein
VGPRAVLNAVLKRKIPSPRRESGDDKILNMAALKNSDVIYKNY